MDATELLLTVKFHKSKYFHLGKLEVKAFWLVWVERP